VGAGGEMPLAVVQPGVQREIVAWLPAELPGAHRTVVEGMRHGLTPVVTTLVPHVVPDLASDVVTDVVTALGSRTRGRGLSDAISEYASSRETRAGSLPCGPSADRSSGSP